MVRKPKIGVIRKCKQNKKTEEESLLPVSGVPRICMCESGTLLDKQIKL
jgi:hypothetical protein